MTRRILLLAHFCVILWIACASRWVVAGEVPVKDVECESLLKTPKKFFNDVMADSDFRVQIDNGFKCYDKFIFTKSEISCGFVDMTISLLKRIKNNQALPDQTKQCESIRTAALTGLGYCPKEDRRYPDLVSRLSTYAQLCALPPTVAISPLPSTGPPAGPPAGPPPKPSMSLKRKLLIGFGIGTAVAGVGLLFGIIPAQLADSSFVRSAASDCLNQGVATPCFNLGPTVGFAAAGSAVTLGGVGLILGGALGK